MQAFRLQFLDAFSQAESHQQEPVCIVRRLYADTTREDEDGASTTEQDHSMKIADFAQTTIFFVARRGCKANVGPIRSKFDVSDTNQNVGHKLQSL